MNQAASAARVGELVKAALATARDEDIDALERAEMLMELAMGLQTRPQTPDRLRAAVTLYDAALAVCPADRGLLVARLTARRSTALQAIPSEGTAELEAARDGYERAIPALQQHGNTREVAEAEMNLGLVLQHLAAAGRTRITDAIAAYQRALRIFDAKRYPVEFALLQNNLAAAFLLMAGAEARAGVREALAVQCFEAGLKAVDPTLHLAEYAMLQNNLGNALQQVASGHPLANRLRALAAYNEALRVRQRALMPLEYANTIANKANCLCGLPDDPEQPEGGNHGNLARARGLCAEARQIFVDAGETGKAELMTEAIMAIDAELAEVSPEPG